MEIWLLLRNFFENNWKEILSFIAGTVSGIVISLLHLHYRRASVIYSITLSHIREFNSERNRSERKQIEKEHKSGRYNVEKITDGELVLIGFFERLSILYFNRYLDKNLIRKTIGCSVLTYWKMLGKKIRNRRPSSKLVKTSINSTEKDYYSYRKFKDFGENFEKFAQHLEKKGALPYYLQFDIYEDIDDYIIKF